MNTAAFDALFDDFTTSAFRLEALSHYEDSEDQDIFDSFLSGQPLPPPEAIDPWSNYVRGACGSGKTIQLVRILSGLLTPYIRFELDWGYLYFSTAGEDIRILESTSPAQIFGDLPHGDFWLFDESIVVEMVYDKRGRFVEPRLVHDSLLSNYLETVKVAQAASQPLTEYLAHLRNA